MNFKELCAKSPAFKATVKTAPNTVVLQWDAVEHADGYRVFTSPHGKNVFRGQITATDTSVKFTGCKNGVPVDYKIKAFRIADGPDNFFCESLIAVACPMITPSGLQVKYAKDGSAAIYFENGGDCDGYKVYTCKSGSDRFTFEKYCFAPPCEFISVDDKFSVKLRAFRMIDGEEKLSNFSDPVELAPQEGVKPRVVEMTCPRSNIVLNEQGRFTDTDGILKNNDNKCTIMLGGDICASAALQKEAFNNSGSFDFAFTYLKSLLMSSDFSAASLDVTLDDDRLYSCEDESVTNAPSFLAASFKECGLDAVTVDKSASGAEKALSKYPVNIINDGIVADIAGIKTGFVYTSLNKKTDAAVSSVREKGAEYVIVFCDWADKHSPAVKPAWRTFAGKLAAAGADFIVGCGVNALCEFDIITTDDGREVPVAYSGGCLLRNDPATKYENIGALICVTLQRHNNAVSAARIGYMPYAMRPYGAARVAVPLFESNLSRFSRMEFDDLSAQIAEQLGKKILPMRRREEPRPISFMLNGSSLISGLFADCENVTTDRSHLFISQMAMCGKKTAPDPKFYADAPLPLYYNLAKGFEEYLEEKPSDYLILDLYYTVASALYEMNGVMYSGGKAFKKSPFFKKYKSKLHQLDFTNETVWKHALDGYIDAVNAAFEGRVILVKVTDPGIYKTNFGMVSELDVTLNARQLGAMQDYFIQRVRPYVIDVPRHFCGKVNKAGACFAINRVEEYSRVISRIALYAARGDADPRLNGEYSRLWLSAIQDSFDEISALSDKSFFFDKNSSADYMISRTSADFIATNFDDLARMKDSGYSGFAELLTKFDFGENRLLKTVCAAINNLRRKKLDDPNISKLIELKLSARDDIASALSAFFDEQGIIPECALTAKDLEFYLKCARMYIGGANKTAVIKLVRAFYEKNRPVTVDMWGGRGLARIVGSSDAVTAGTLLTDRSALTAFTKKPEADLSYLDRSSIYYKEFSGSFSEKLGKSGDWIIVDFPDIINAVYRSDKNYYSVPDGFENTNFYNAFCKGDEKHIPYEQGDLDDKFITDAAAKAADYLKGRYGKNIILSRIEYKLNYIDLDGTIKPFDDGDAEKKNAFIRRFEDMFIELTGCHVIELADKFAADRSSCRARPNRFIYEPLFYAQAARALEVILSGKDEKPVSNVDIVSYIERTELLKATNPDMSPALLRQLCGGMYELLM